MVYRLPGLWINDVRGTFTVGLIVITVAAGGVDAATIDVDNRLDSVFPVGRLLDRHPPGLVFAVRPAAYQYLAYRHQITGDLLLLHQSREVISSIVLPHHGETDKQIGDIFSQELPAALIDNLQMLQAGTRLRRDYRLDIQGGNRLLIRVKASQTDQRPHDDIHYVVRLGANP